MAVGDRDLTVPGKYCMFSMLYFEVFMQTCPSSGWTGQQSRKRVVFQGLSRMYTSVLLNEL